VFIFVRTTIKSIQFYKQTSVFVLVFLRVVVLVLLAKQQQQKNLQFIFNLSRLCLCLDFSFYNTQNELKVLKLIIKIKHSFLFLKQKLIFLMWFQQLYMYTVVAITWPFSSICYRCRSSQVFNENRQIWTAPILCALVLFFKSH
jgi:hypothetical protein